MDVKKIDVLNYKCFTDIHIDNIKPINIIIGKNNIGKSSVLDIVEGIYGSRTINMNTKILLTKEMDEDVISRVFQKSTSGGTIGGNHYEFGKKYIGQDISFIRKSDSSNQIPDDFEKYNPHLTINQIDYWSRVAHSIKIDPKVTKRILAERNIFPEDNDDNMIVDSNGNGITRIITNFLNRSKYNENLVKNDLLQNLNIIMGDDANFTEIVTQQIDSDEGTKWEIYLREEGKGRISLSESGSGLKTILMVLVFTILIPNVEHKKISQYIFLFEELENNLHPSLQRRLLKYIENLTEDGAIFFLTTHSNVTLDAYQNSDITNIIHLQKEDSQVKLINITNKIQKNTILNDLGIKASDLLQSNGIIWVEGPSDRVYINNWIKIHKKTNIVEGKDYQCVFYGGRLLSNLSLEDENELVNLMSVNRNAIIVLDSDKKGNNTPLNKTKKRIIEEAKKQGILVWVTKGREIENYIPELLVKKKYNKENSKCSFGQFQNIEEFIDKLKKGEGNKFLRDKINFAKDITNDCNWEDFKNCYDLDKMITKVESKVLDWNNDK
ncbi:MAG: AAA family ATPase [Bacilli bacterium]